ncbi:hypothetical protein L910_1622 [Vibrio fluvialis PG41]|uniref:Uncharacterized protein n=1 Tax=Vibrio fluvialis PG41 TaxID=1336752 RepID=S7JF42_VIBFL|nr:hypothetical protein L910_1622 [Vibrio fluvialis PG41]
MTVFHPDRSKGVSRDAEKPTPIARSTGYNGGVGDPPD